MYLELEACRLIIQNLPMKCCRTPGHGVCLVWQHAGFCLCMFLCAESARSSTFVPVQEKKLEQRIQERLYDKFKLV